MAGCASSGGVSRPSYRRQSRRRLTLFRGIDKTILLDAGAQRGAAGEGPMPIYEYECPGCQKRFSRLRPIREMDEPCRCPECGNDQARRVLSLISATQKANCTPSG
jgi:putative FmdB family regulatory protein